LSVVGPRGVAQRGNEGAARKNTEKTGSYERKNTRANLDLELQRQRAGTQEKEKKKPIRDKPEIRLNVEQPGIAEDMREEGSGVTLRTHLREQCFTSMKTRKKNVKGGGVHLGTPTHCAHSQDSRRKKEEQKTQGCLQRKKLDNGSPGVGNRSVNLFTDARTPAGDR